MIDRAAIEAVRKWRYRPTLVEGSPKQVLVPEVVDVFPDEGSKPGYFSSMLNDKREARAYRLLATQRLEAIGAHPKTDAGDGVTVRRAGAGGVDVGESLERNELTLPENHGAMVV